MNVDAVVLDIDGVLVDVENSYRRAIVESLEHVYGDTIDREDVQLFKDAGGFNDDWELTDAAALYVLARRERPRLSIETYTGLIAASGGGLESARTAVADELDPAGRPPTPTSTRSSYRARRSTSATFASVCTSGCL